MSLKDVMARRTTPYLGVGEELEERGLQQMGSKWESEIDPTAEFRLFLSLNKTGSLLSSSTSTLHPATRLEIWSTSDHSLIDSFTEDFQGTSCMVWRADDSYYFGSHHAAIRYYRDGMWEGT